MRNYILVLNTLFVKVVNTLSRIGSKQHNLGCLGTMVYLKSEKAYNVCYELTLDNFSSIRTFCLLSNI